MSRMDADAELLLVEGGGWLVGIDPAEVRRIENVAEDGSTAGRHLADLLGTRSSCVAGEPRRVIDVGTHDVPERILVERTRETWTVPLEALHAVPAVLTVAGAPTWWLGLTWVGDDMVLLVDLGAAARAAQEHTER